MTDVTHQQLVTVFHACKPSRHAEVCQDAEIEVTERKPPSGDWSVLYELHVLPSEISSNKGGELRVPWSVAAGRPLQISTP